MTGSSSTTIDLDTEIAATTDTTSVVVVEESAPGAVVDEDAELPGGLPPRAIQNGDGTVTLPLRVSVSVRIKKDGREREDTYAKFTFHRLVGADVRAIQSTAKDSQGAVMLARSAKIREPVMSVLFDKMDAADIMDASKIVERFFGSGPKTQE